MFTGFALKYPHHGSRSCSSTRLVRSYIHRVAGVVLIAVSLFHVWYVIVKPEGRQLVIDMLPDWKDVTDARDAFRYYLGYSDQRPMFRRFSYAEKTEYWALVWGMFVMADTGLMVWFKVARRRSRCRDGGSMSPSRFTFTKPCWPHWPSSCGTCTGSSSIPMRIR